MGKKKPILITILLCLFSLLCTGCHVLDTVQTSMSQELGRLVVGEPEQVESISLDKYAYNALSQDEKLVYDQVLDAILQQERVVPVSTRDTDVLQKAYDSVMADYGGLFWVSGYQYNTYTSGKTVLGLEFMGNYTMTQEEREQYQHEIDARVEEWMTGISLVSSDYEKSKYVFETLISHVDYDVASENNQNIISVFINEKTVCQGYADAVQYLLNQLQVPCTIITGIANEQPHAWNLVQLDGAYYYMDVTWGNSRYMDSDAAQKKNINYSYLNAGDHTLSETHIPQVSFPLPECNSTKNQYYMQEGRYFDTWNPEAIGQIMGNAWREHQSQVSVKMSDDELYDRLVNYFIIQQHIGDYCSGIRELRYIQDPGDHVLIVQLD